MNFVSTRHPEEIPLFSASRSAAVTDMFKDLKGRHLLKSLVFIMGTQYVGQNCAVSGYGRVEAMRQSRLSDVDAAS